MVHAVHEDQHRQIANGWFRAAVFGVSDGLVTNASLILGFAGASPGHDVVRLAGLAGLCAGGLSMASGEYVSMRAQKELLEYEINVERTSLRNFPHEERAELRDMFLAQGIAPDVADRLSNDLMSDPDLALRTHAREELGIDPSATGSPWRAAGSSLVSFAIGAFIPLAPWVFTTSGDPIGLFAVGGVIGWFTRNGIIRWGLRQLVIGGLAAFVTFWIGRAVGAT